MSHMVTETRPDYVSSRVIERADGYFWRSRTDKWEFGPFPTLIAAVQDMHYREHEQVEPGEAVE